MHKLINRKAVILIGLALILAAGGLSIASNMGFKFVKSYANGQNTNANNRNTIALPYFQSQFVNASDLQGDNAEIVQVCEYTGAAGAPSPTNCWTPSSFNNFALVPGRAYEVAVANPTTQVIVGAHNPAFSITLAAAPTVNVAALPYHTTYVTAADVCNDIGVTCNQICQVLSPIGTNCWTTGSFNNFNIAIGDGYEIDVSGATPFVPDHY